MIAAALTNICTVLHMLLERKSMYEGQPSINPLDRFLRRHVCEPLQKGIGSHRSEKYGEALYHSVLSLSDTQLVTGIAILVPAFAKLSNGSITMYHFTIVLDLGWIASNTYNLTLLVRGRRHSAKAPASPSRIHISLLLRILFMILVDGMLLYAS